MGIRNIAAEELRLGRDITVEPGCTIGGIRGPARRVVIGDNVFIGSDVRILAPEVYIGDYTTIHNHTTIYGYAPVRIGDCCWLGQNVIVNCTAPVWLGDGVVISAYSNLWSHFRGGDILQGCRFDRERPLAVGDDAWIGVQCTVAPVLVHRRALVLAGAVVTHDLAENHVYAGNPARDVTERMGPHCEELTLEEKFELLKGRLIDFDRDWGRQQMPYRVDAGPSDVLAGALAVTRPDPRFGGDEEGDFYAAGIVVTRNPWRKSDVPVFSVADRSYSKQRTPQEIAFMRFLLPQIKFYPHERPELQDLQARFAPLIPGLEALIGGA